MVRSRSVLASVLESFALTFHDIFALSVDAPASPFALFNVSSKDIGEIEPTFYFTFSTSLISIHVPYSSSCACSSKLDEHRKGGEGWCKGIWSRCGGSCRRPGITIFCNRCKKSRFQLQEDGTYVQCGWRGARPLHMKIAQCLALRPSPQHNKMNFARM